MDFSWGLAVEYRLKNNTTPVVDQVTYRNDLSMCGGSGHLHTCHGVNENCYFVIPIKICITQSLDSNQLLCSSFNVLEGNCR